MNRELDTVLTTMVTHVTGFIFFVVLMFLAMVLGQPMWPFIPAICLCAIWWGKNYRRYKQLRKALKDKQGDKQ